MYLIVIRADQPLRLLHTIIITITKIFIPIFRVGYKHTVYIKKIGTISRSKRQACVSGRVPLRSVRA